MEKGVLILLCILLTCFSSGVVAKSYIQINEDERTIQIPWDSEEAREYKAMVEKEVKKTYFYDLYNGENTFPLQMGKGKYAIRILKQIYGNRYQIINEKTIELKSADNEKVYLASIQNIPWKEAPTVIEKAKELAQKCTTTEEKIKEIYRYIVENIKYEGEEKPSGYIPNPELVLSEKTGICYDFASLFACMTRSLGIPTKLVMGHPKHLPEYHAWNEVFLDGEWIVIDTVVNFYQANPKLYPAEKHY